MSPLDLLVGALILAAIVSETFRGFGKALFDGLTLYTALWATNVAYVPLAGAVHLAATPAANQGFVFGVCFVVFGAVALVISHFAYGSVLLNLGMFDKFFGLIAGLAVGLIVAHGIVRTVDISSARDGSSSIVASSALAEQVLDFQSYHSFVDSLYNLTAG